MTWLGSFWKFKLQLELAKKFLNGLSSYLSPMLRTKSELMLMAILLCLESQKTWRMDNISDNIILKLMLFIGAPNQPKFYSFLTWQKYKE